MPKQDWKQKLKDLKGRIRRPRIKGVFKRSTGNEHPTKKTPQDWKKGLAKSFSRFSKKRSSGSGMSWDEAYSKIFSPLTRPKVHRFFVISFITAVAISFGRGLGLSPLAFYAPPPPVRAMQDGGRPAPAPQINAIIAHNPFGLKVNDRPEVIAKKVTKKKINPNKICTSARDKSSLPIQLHNTIVLQNSAKSLASFTISGKRQSLRVGDNLQDMAKIGKISRERIIIKNLSTDNCEFIAMPTKRKDQFSRPRVLSPSKGRKLLNKSKNKGIVNNGNKFKVKKSVRDKALSDFNSLLTQARAVQIKNPDGSLAFKMTEIEAGSLYSQLNIQNGDVIKGINGEKIQNVNQLMGLFSKIKTIDHFELTIGRGGSNVNQEYDFE